MKRRGKIIVCAIFLLLLTACSNNQVSESVEQEQTAAAEKIVTYFNEEDYDKIIEQMDAKMKASLTAEKLAEVQPIITKSGVFDSFEKSSVKKSGDNYTVTLVAKYSEEKRIFTISFDQAQQLSGLYVK